MLTNANRSPSKTNMIGWVAYQLAHDHGIEMTDLQIWMKILEDAGLNECIAMEMLIELSKNKIAISEFAKSLEIEFVPHPRRDSGRDAFMFCTIALFFFCIGLLVGAVL